MSTKHPAQTGCFLFYKITAVRTNLRTNVSAYESRNVIDSGERKRYDKDKQKRDFVLKCEDRT